MSFIKKNKTKIILVSAFVVLIAVFLVWKGFSTEKSESENLEKGNSLSCYLSVTCGDILENISSFNKEKIDLLPEDGAILAKQEVEFEAGESVFDVLLRTMQKKGIHMEFEKASGNKGAYVRGIGNVYEFDCGEMSGWTYKVNGESPSVGYSDYILEDGDVVEWIYICSFDFDM